MRPLDQIESRIDEIADGGVIGPTEAADELMQLGEQVLEHWIVGRFEEPTMATREGFRLLALHRQGARGEPSFNACRETCRELAYHYNLVQADPQAAEVRQRVRMAGLIAKHLCLFVSGKMQVEGLGTFCCSSRPLRAGGK